MAGSHRSSKAWRTAICLRCTSRWPGSWTHGVVCDAGLALLRTFQNSNGSWNDSEVFSTLEYTGAAGRWR